MSYDQGLAQRIRDLVAGDPNVGEREMFGGVAFMLGDKMFIGIVGDELMVRVGPERYDDALANPHARPMNFTGRPMKGYVFVGPEGYAEDGTLRGWIDWAANVVRDLLLQAVKSQATRSQAAKSQATKSQDMNGSGGSTPARARRPTPAATGVRTAKAAPTAKARGPKHAATAGKHKAAAGKARAASGRATTKRATTKRATTKRATTKRAATKKLAAKTTTAKRVAAKKLRGVRSRKVAAARARSRRPS